MQPDASPPPQRRTVALLTSDGAATWLFALIAAIYFWQAGRLALTTSLWMDEVLSLWTARLSGLPQIWGALRNGAEFTPPLYDSFLHALITAGIATPGQLRLPSIAAGFLAALAIYMLVRRRTDPMLAALAGSAVLAGGLFEFAVQLRPYVFVTAAFGWALWLWDGLPERRPLPRVRTIALAALLVIMVALHFYAALLVATLGLGEVVRAAFERRAPRLGVFAAVAAAGGSTLLWWPILSAAASYSGADVGAAAYYGKPSLAALAGAYAAIVGWPGAVALGMGASLVLTQRRSLSGGKHAALAIVLTAIPLIVFLFALLISHSFASRYCVTATFGVALLLAWAAAQLGAQGRPFALVLLVLLVVLPVGRQVTQIGRPDRQDVLELVRQAPGDGPIAVGSGLRFLELAGNLPPELSHRVVYLDLPGTPSPDPTNRHQVERWKAIDPDLPVADARRFVCANPHFLLLTDPYGGTDDVPAWLAGRAALAQPSPDRVQLIPVASRPCEPDASSGSPRGEAGDQTGHREIAD